MAVFVSVRSADWFGAIVKVFVGQPTLFPQQGLVAILPFGDLFTKATFLKATLPKGYFVLTLSKSYLPKSDSTKRLIYSYSIKKLPFIQLTIPKSPKPT